MPLFPKKTSDAQGTIPAANRFKESPVKKEFAFVLTVNKESKKRTNDVKIIEPINPNIG